MFAHYFQDIEPTFLGQARVALVPSHGSAHLEDIETLIGKSETVEKRKRNQAVKNPKENKACDRWSP